MAHDLTIEDTMPRTFIMLLFATLADFLGYPQVSVTKTNYRNVLGFSFPRGVDMEITWRRNARRT